MGKLSDEIISRASRLIEQKGMLQRGDGVVLAVSGGSDSVAMLHIFLHWRAKWELRLVIAHLNHSLRGEESDLDEEFVKKLSQMWDVPIETRKINVKMLKDSWHLSTEEAARKVRYEFLEEIMRKYGFKKIATAHHADDQIETIFLSIIRGTGPKGIVGIPFMRDGKFIRPLMGLRKWEILEYLKENGIQHIEDRTNRDISFKRNWVRHELIPMLRKWNPRIEEAVLRLSSLMEREEDYLSLVTEGALRSAIISEKEGSISLHIDKINPLHEAISSRVIRRSISRILKGDTRGFSFSHIDAIMELIKKGNTGSKLHLPRGISVEKSYNQLTFKKGKEVSPVKFCYAVSVPGDVVVPETGHRICFRIFEIQGELDIAGDRRIAYLDADRVPDKLFIRSLLKGDRFRPLGLGGTKKLKDFFIDHKIPREDRCRIPILAGMDVILWVVGWRIDDRFKVTPITKRVLQARIVEFY